MSHKTDGQNDAELLRGILAGDERAFRKVFETNYQALCGFVNNYVHAPDIAAELVQDVFLKMWDRRKELEIQGSLRGYLFGAARNHALNYVKHQQVEEKTYPFVTPPRRQYTEDELHHAELAAAFNTVVDALPEGQRTILVLHWSNGLAHSEIAKILGISVKGVETQLGRAMKTIRQELAAFKI